MVTRPWVPRPGEIIKMDLNPTLGHEQANERPAVVLSAQGFNDKSSRVVCVPCTTNVKKGPWEVAISGLNQQTVALSDQIRRMGWRARKAIQYGSATEAEMLEILGKIQALIGIR